MEKLAIVVPCYNEEEVLKIASEALRGVLDDLIHKGKIAEGYDADLVLIDRKTLRDRATYQDSNQKADGIEAVYVAGVCVYRDKQLTGACPGRLLHRNNK